MDKTANYLKVNVDNFYKLKELFPNDFENRFEQFSNRQIDIFAIETDEKFIGKMVVNYSNHLLDTETIPYKRVCFSHFILFKDYRNKGYGSKLLEFALEDLIKNGYSEFTVGVEDKNEIAKHIYFKYGFNELIDHGNNPCEYDLYLKR